MAQELFSSCCTTDSLVLLAFVTRAHIKTLLEVETLEELMVTQTAKVEDKLVDLIANRYLKLHLIFEYRH